MKILSIIFKVQLLALLIVIAAGDAMALPTSGQQGKVKTIYRSRSGGSQTANVRSVHSDSSETSSDLTQDQRAMLATGKAKKETKEHQAIYRSRSGGSATANVR